MGVFENQVFWENYGLTPDYQQRLAKITGLLPNASMSLLDIGCGDGAVLVGLEHFRPNYKYYGIDTFFPHSKQTHFSFLQASLPFLPYKNKSLDVVLCLEVLEHLPEIEASIHEIQRVTSRQIVFGVPYRENLHSLVCVCKKCKSFSHAYGHLHSFTENDMVDLFPEFKLDSLQLTGKMQKRVSRLGIWLEHHLANSFYQPDHFMCPHCGCEIAEKKKKPIGIYQIMHSINLFLTFLSPNLPYWMIASYTRK